MVRLFLARGAKVGSRTHLGYTAFHTACVSGNLAIVQELLAAGASINEMCTDGRTALHWLAFGGATEGCVEVRKQSMWELGWGG